MKIKIKTFGLDEEIPNDIILPNQIHGTKIVEIVSGSENLISVDGIFTKDKTKILAVQTADCAPICFWDNKKFGIIHSGWRGLVSGICEKMMNNFVNPNIFVGPFLPEFEIKKDFCFEEISEVFGKDFFIEKRDKIVFDFKSAILSVLPNAKFDGRNTFAEKNLASWRRDKNDVRNVTLIRESL